MMKAVAGAEGDWGSVVHGVQDAAGKLRRRNDPLGRFLSEAADRILYLASMEKKLDDHYFEKTPLEELARENSALFPVIEGDAYANSPMNPAVTVPSLGKEAGQALSSWRSGIDMQAHMMFRHDTEIASIVFGALPSLAALDDPSGIPSVTGDVFRRTWARRFIKANLERFNPDFAFFRDTIHRAKPGDFRYLYRYGVRIGPSDFETARHVDSLPEEKADLIASTIIRGFERGFVEADKDLSKKSAASVNMPAGYERIGRKMEAELLKRSIRPAFDGVAVRPRNEQLSYDHRFDWAMYIDKGLKQGFLETARQGLEAGRAVFSAHAGPILVGTFGKEPFSPAPNEHAVAAGPEANAVYREMMVEVNQLFDRFIPRAETGFVMADFPSPEIRGDFGAIFEETVRINTLDNDEYAVIQKAMIDALDSGEVVKVKGVPGNRTDLQVRLHHLDDPAHQTNFLNCLASDNIPLGEVFTSPVLKGTNGMLHVSEAFIGGLKYRDLFMEFRDGYVSDYGCANFGDPEKGKQYVYENMLQPHDTLPMGEFAIGTNTWAYRMGTVHRIMDLLPVLILEKTGPHIAIGDTCFSWEEDRALYNPIDHKEIVARENEKSCLRKTNPMEAYTSKHTDITLPYTTLGSISVIADDGSEIFIYREGRFVLPGTEKLNEALGGL
jgi:aminopeptidase